MDESVSYEDEINRFLKRICCICAGNERFMHPLLESNSAKKETHYSMLTRAVPQMSKYHLHEYGMICIKCSAELNIVNKFREKCLKSSDWIDKQIKRITLQNKSNDTSTVSSSANKNEVRKKLKQADAKSKKRKSISKPNIEQVENIVSSEILRTTVNENFQNELTENGFVSCIKTENFSDEEVEDNSEQYDPPLQKVETVYVKIENKNEEVESEEAFDESIEFPDGNSVASSSTNHSNNGEKVENIFENTSKGTNTLSSHSDSVCTSGDQFPNKQVETGQKRKYNKGEYQHVKQKRVEAGKEVICEICNKTCPSLSHLQHHTRSHTGEKPFPCDECDKAFSQLSNLVRHKLVHSGEKPHTCDQCYKSFSQMTNLVAHKRIHSGEKPFNCGICERAFTTATSLTAHKRTHYRGMY